MNIAHSTIHGVGELTWDHASVPENVWKKTQQLPNGCWASTKHFTDIWRHRKLTIKAVTGLDHAEYIYHPTCSNYRCINPAHMCVTLKTALSLRK